MKDSPPKKSFNFFLMGTVFHHSQINGLINLTFLWRKNLQIFSSFDFHPNEQISFNKFVRTEHVYKKRIVYLRRHHKSILDFSLISKYTMQMRVKYMNLSQHNYVVELELLKRSEINTKPTLLVGILYGLGLKTRNPATHNYQLVS